MEFILGLIIGIVVGGGAIIVFGKNNKRKVENARLEILKTYEKVKDKFDGNKDAQSAINKIK